MTTSDYKFTFTLDPPELMPPQWGGDQAGTILVSRIDYRLNAAHQMEEFVYRGKRTTKSGKAHGHSADDHRALPPVEDRALYERLVRQAFSKYLELGSSLLSAAIGAASEANQ